MVNGLFRVGMSLESAADLPYEMAVLQIADAVGHVDDIIGEIRDYVFAGPGRDGQPGAVPPNGSR